MFLAGKQESCWCSWGGWRRRPKGVHLFKNVESWVQTIGVPAPWQRRIILVLESVIFFSNLARWCRSFHEITFVRCAFRKDSIPLCSYYDCFSFWPKIFMKKKIVKSQVVEMRNSQKNSLISNQKSKCVKSLLLSQTFI